MSAPRVKRLYCLLATLLAASPVAARPAATGHLHRPAKAAARQSQSPIRLEITPAAIELNGAEAAQHLLVTGVFRDGRQVDLTDRCRLRSLRPDVARLSGGAVVAIGDGAAVLTASLPGAAAAGKVSVRVKGAHVARPISFTNDIDPLLTKAGCSSGGCHGKSGGQNGFQLSLLGFDPRQDFDALVLLPKGRRVCLTDPANSLFLRKATGLIPHGGGRRFEAGSPEYRTLLRWVAAGAPFGTGTEPTIERIEVSPRARMMTRKGRQHFVTTAYYSDGTSRDVTAQADYRTNEETIAQVDPDGTAHTLDLTGETTVMARYMGQVAVARLTIPMEGKTAAGLPGSDPWSLAPRANFVDELVLRKLKRLNVPPSGLCSDEEFLRRAFLDTIGALPTPEEAKSFLAECRSSKDEGGRMKDELDPGPSRSLHASQTARTHLVDRLLVRTEYADYWAVIWSDILRVNRSLLGTDKNAQQYHAWIRASFAANKPYDQFVREILTAVGSGQANGAVNFYRVAFESPTAFAEVTNSISQTFLGTRIECAQCHHHPYEKWSQQDFYGLAAFFTRVKNRRSKDGDVEYFADKAGDLRFPRTGQVVLPRVLDGADGPVAPGEDPRTKLAMWMTAKENPFLARALANRLWAHYLGRGLVEPIDDLRTTNPATNPDLLDALAKELVDHGFDVKRLTRTILTSSTYQLSSTASERNRHDTQNFSHAYLKRLPAEVLLDAVCAVTGVPEAFDGMPAGTRAIQLWNNKTASYFLDVFGRPLRVSPCECERSAEPNVAQALHLMNAPQIQSKLEDARGRVARLVAGGAKDEQLVGELYLAAFSRYPRLEEDARARSYLAGKPDRLAAAEDLLWALLNSREFVFNH